jgi:hypothetical protein
MSDFSRTGLDMFGQQPRSTSHAITSRRYERKLGEAPPSIFSGLARHNILKEEERTRHVSAQLIRTARNTSYDARKTIEKCTDMF